MVLADINAGACEAEAQDLRSEAIGVEMDVTSALSIEAAIGHVPKRCGRVDLLVNNAGVLVVEANMRPKHHTEDA